MVEIVLFMSVGTGGSTEDSEKSLALALVNSIVRLNPSQIIFFVSKESRSTVELIEKCYRERTGKDLPRSECVEFNRIDSFDECFPLVSEKIRYFQDAGDEVMINYTSGTKTMTMVMGVAAILHHCTLILTEGKRDDHGVVCPGTERMCEQRLYSVYDKMLFDDAVGMFNACRFEEALSVLKKIAIHEYKSVLSSLCETFMYWDRLEYGKASECFGKVDLKQAKILVPDIEKKVKYIKTLNASNEHIDESRKDARDSRFTDESKDKAKGKEQKNLVQKYKMILADLMCNAHRRFEEGKYEDAVARLYRSVELVAQIQLLRKAGLNDLEGAGLSEAAVIPLLPLDKQGQYRDKARDGKFLFGAMEKFVLLSVMSEPHRWKNGISLYEGIKSDLGKRNKSVLAHGVTPVTREDAGNMEEKVRNIVSQSLDEDVMKMASLMDEAEFPRINFE